MIGAVLLIAAVVWWFFGSHKASKVEAVVNDSKQTATVVVDGGYKPQVVELKQGVSAEVVFDRKDPSGCLAQVVFPDFGVQADLPLGERYSIDIDTSKAGEYTYACGMNMFHGKVVVK